MGISMAPEKKKLHFKVADIGEIKRLFKTVVNLEPSISYPIINTFYKWVECSGPEWAVGRMKAMKCLYFQYLAGNKDFSIDIRTRKLNGYNAPVGPFRALWTMGSTYRQVRKCVNILCLHTGITAMELTPTQKKKFYTSVEHPRPGKDISSLGFEIAPEISYGYRSTWGNSRFDSIDRWVSSSSKRVKCLIFDHKVNRANLGSPPLRSHCEDNLTKDMHLANFVAMCPSLIVGDFSELFWEATRDAFFRNVTDASEIREWALSESAFQYTSYYQKLFDLDLPIVGSIGFVQEPGCKLRAVANPLRYIQVGLSRLHNWLMQTIPYLPWDCTYDQARGVRWARQQLDAGRRLVAYDLSDASNTIPLSDQINFLKYVGPKNDKIFDTSLKLLEKVSRGVWLDNENPNADYTIWKKGQPLGALASFPSFSQLHGARLATICSWIGMDSNLSFRVLGDDVIMVEEISSLYHRFVTEYWGCDISETKSISSDKLTEFASVLPIKGKGCIRQNKVVSQGKLFNPKDPLRTIRLYGKRGLKIVPKPLRDHCAVIAAMDKPKGYNLKWSPCQMTSTLDWNLAGKFLSSLPMPLRVDMVDYQIDYIEVPVVRHRYRKIHSPTTRRILGKSWVSEFFETSARRRRKIIRVFTTNHDLKQRDLELAFRSLSIRTLRSLGYDQKDIDRITSDESVPWVEIDSRNMDINRTEAHDIIDFTRDFDSGMGAGPMMSTDPDLEIPPWVSRSHITSVSHHKLEASDVFFNNYHLNLALRDGLWTPEIKIRYDLQVVLTGMIKPPDRIGHKYISRNGLIGNRLFRKLATAIDVLIAHAAKGFRDEGGGNRSCFEYYLKSIL